MKLEGERTSLSRSSFLPVLFPNLECLKILNSSVFLFLPPRASRTIVPFTPV